jgi:hypothetical protein
MSYLSVATFFAMRKYTPKNQAILCVLVFCALFGCQTTQVSSFDADALAEIALREQSDDVLYLLDLYEMNASYARELLIERTGEEFETLVEWRAYVQMQQIKPSQAYILWKLNYLKTTECDTI